jgi:hypothetical protein
VSPAVARDDHGRRIVESFALTQMLLAVHTLKRTVRAVCDDDGVRSVTIAADDAEVRFSYPIWFAQDGEPVSWQMDVTHADGRVTTVMTGLDADCPGPHLRALLDAIGDPAALVDLCAAGVTGPADVAALLGLPA